MHEAGVQPAVPAGAAPAERVCASSDLPEAGNACVWDVLQYGRKARAFVLRMDGQARAYLNRCVHVPTEMDWLPGEFLDSDKRFIICSIHGATYDPHNGQCVGGPCGRGRLTPVAVQEHDGQVYWYPSHDIRPMPLNPSADPAPADESPHEP